MQCLVRFKLVAADRLVQDKTFAVGTEGFLLSGFPDLVVTTEGDDIPSRGDVLLVGPVGLLLPPQEHSFAPSWYPCSSCPSPPFAQSALHAGPAALQTALLVFCLPFQLLLSLVQVALPPWITIVLPLLPSIAFAPATSPWSMSGVPPTFATLDPCSPIPPFSSCTRPLGRPQGDTQGSKCVLSWSYKYYEF